MIHKYSNLRWIIYWSGQSLHMTQVYLSKSFSTHANTDETDHFHYTHKWNTQMMVQLVFRDKIKNISKFSGMILHAFGNHIHWKYCLSCLCAVFNYAFLRCGWFLNSEVDGQVEWGMQAFSHQLLTNEGVSSTFVSKRASDFIFRSLHPQHQ